MTSGHARSEPARVVTTPAYARQTETNDARLRQRHDGDENVYRDAPHGIVCRARAAALCHPRLGSLLHATNNSNGTNLSPLKDVIVRHRKPAFKLFLHHRAEIHGVFPNGNEKMDAVHLCALVPGALGVSFAGRFSPLPHRRVKP